MRRSFKGNQLYTAVFNEYLHTLFSRGFSTEYFVEGGRSRTGRMLHPRTGMLAITLRSFLRDSRRPIVFVPVYIGYERVLEGRTYLGELRGATKKKESIFDLFKVVGALKQRFGQVCELRRADPSRPVPSTATSPTGRTRTSARNTAPTGCRRPPTCWPKDVARHLNDAAAINPVNLVALALLSTSRQALDESALARILDLYLALLRRCPTRPARPCRTATARPLIEYVKSMNLLAEQKDALGRIPLSRRTERGAGDLLPQQRPPRLRPAGADRQLLPEQLADQPRTVAALRPRALSLPAGGTVHPLEPGRTRRGDRPVAGGPGGTGPAAPGERHLHPPGAKLAAICAADPPRSFGDPDPAALLHGHRPVAQRRAERPDRRGNWRTSAP